MNALQRYNLQFGIRNGFPVARVATIEDTLMDFLESDLQTVQSSDHAMQLLSGNMSSESTWNATLVRVQESDVEIESLWDAERSGVRLSRSDLIEIIAAWTIFLSKHRAAD